MALTRGRFLGYEFDRMVMLFSMVDGDSDQIPQRSEVTRWANYGPMHRQQKAPLFDHLVGPSGDGAAR